MSGRDWLEHMAGPRRFGPIPGMRRIGAALVIVLVTAGLAACAASNPYAQEYSAFSIQPLVDAATATQRCVADKGFVVDVLPTGVITYTSKQVPDDQAAKASTAIDECWAKVGLPDKGEWPRDELPRLYGLELAARECILKLGIPVEEPPSLQRYIDTYATQRWSAHAVADAQPLGLASFLALKLGQEGGKILFRFVLFTHGAFHTRSLHFMHVHRSTHTRFCICRAQARRDA